MRAAETAGKRARVTPGRRRLAGWLVIALAVLLAARPALPAILVPAINGKLSRTPEYAGRVDDVGLALIRGAYVIDGIELRKRGGAAGAPLFTARRLDLPPRGASCCAVACSAGSTSRA